MADHTFPLGINYKPLTDPLEIRVLVLKKTTGNVDDPIECEFLHTSLAVGGNLLPYQALSYEWGDISHGVAQITTDGVSVCIRRNLHEALKQIRTASDLSNICLWVDALCINQADLDERSHQVGIMGEIFRSASSVIAWLGIAADGSDVAMDMMADHNKLAQYIEMLVAENRIEDDPDLQDMTKLCSRSYWRRVWIIQELYLARDHVVRCGTKVVSGDEFEDSLAVTCRGYYPSSWRGMNKTPANEHRLARQRRHMSLSGNGVNKLHRWVAFCSDGGFQASDKRDYIYALLGITDGCEHGDIVPDYRKRPVDVVLDALPWLQMESTMPGNDWRYRRFKVLVNVMGLDAEQREDLRRILNITI